MGVVRWIRKEIACAHTSMIWDVDFLHMDRQPQNHQIDLVVSSSFSFLLWSFGHNILSVN